MCIVFPPLAVLWVGGIFSAILNVILTLFFWLPGVVHAILIVNRKRSDQRHKEQMKELRRIRSDPPMSRPVATEISDASAVKVENYQTLEPVRWGRLKFWSFFLLILFSSIIFLSVWTEFTSERPDSSTDSVLGTIEDTNQLVENNAIEIKSERIAESTLTLVTLAERDFIPSEINALDQKECKKANLSSSIKLVCAEYVGKTISGFNKKTSFSWVKGVVVGLTKKTQGDLLSLLINPDTSYVAKETGLYILYQASSDNSIRIAPIQYGSSDPTRHVFE